MTAPRSAYVVAARRTPIGRVGGMLRHFTAGQLAARVIEQLVRDLGLGPRGVDEVVLGNVWGPGGNLARLAALTAGLDESVTGLTVDRQCASGLEAINLAARLVQAGAADVCLAGGVESLSTAPWRIEKPATVHHTPVFAERAHFSPDAIGDPDMGPAADSLARAYGVSRERQDAFAFASHRKALEAASSGRFDGELVGLAADVRDECPRPRLTRQALGRLRPAFAPDGTATAGNSSGLNDGAAVVAVVSADVRRRLPNHGALRIVDAEAAGVDARQPGAGPIAATRALLARHPSMTVDDLDLVEITEAFAGQALACLDALEVDPDRVNVGGGAIALGHPWGASGAILVTRLFAELLRPGSEKPPRLGLATIAAAGGIGVSTLLERA